MSKQKLIPAAQLRKKTTKELISLLNETQLAKSQGQMALSAKRSKNTNILKPSKRTIARIKTVLGEKRTLSKLEVSNK